MVRTANRLKQRWMNWFFQIILQDQAKKSSNDFAVIISFNGMNYIKDKFNALSEKTKNDLEMLRVQLETHTHDGILNIILTHFPEQNKLSIHTKHSRTLDWVNDC